MYTTANGYTKYIFGFILSVWSMSGEGADMGDEAARWICTFLKMEGCRMFFMSPAYKPMELQADDDWTDITKPGDQVRRNWNWIFA